MNEVYRQEKKYFMTLFDMKKLSGQLDQVMIQDAHNGANGYNIRSLYFDTINERDYETKIDGLELRRKIRLRIYDPAADFAMLEMKQKKAATRKSVPCGFPGRCHRADKRQVSQPAEIYGPFCGGVLRAHAHGVLSPQNHCGI